MNVYVNVSPGAISTIWWFIAVWLAWKSMEWVISPLLVRCTLTVSPRWTRMVGPGTVPPNVQAWTTKPSATGAPGALALVGLASGACIAATAASPPTVISPFMPASPCPGIEQMNASPPSGTVTVPVAVSPPAAESVVPSANVTSWSIAPVLLNVTS